MSEILTPLKENIEQFKKTINDSYSNEARERFSLQERIKELIELNQSISKEAKDLTTALKGNSKVQGDWGEQVLTNILHDSGLREGEEYFVQDNVKDEEGKNVLDQKPVAISGVGGFEELHPRIMVGDLLEDAGMRLFPVEVGLSVPDEAVQTGDWAMTGADQEALRTQADDFLTFVSENEVK